MGDEQAEISVRDDSEFLNRLIREFTQCFPVLPRSSSTGGSARKTRR